MRLRRFNDEVFFAAGPEVRLDRAALDAFARRARRAPRGRWRLCIHRDEKAPVHQMLIWMPRGSYIRPHLHRARQESCQILRGRARLVYFDGRGRPERVVRLGEPGSGRTFFYRLETPRYHTLVVESPVLVYLETKAGPFRRSDTRFPAWAPPETEAAGGLKFLRELRRTK